MVGRCEWAARRNEQFQTRPIVSRDDRVVGMLSPGTYDLSKGRGELMTFEIRLDGARACCDL